MNRIYHNHNKWEEVKYNMYGSYNKKEKDKLINIVIKYFNDFELVDYFMEKVIREFKYSCEHNLTNPSMNKVAWLGQASVSLFAKIPEEKTRLAWNELEESTKNKCDEIAIKKIQGWESCQKDI